MPNDVSPSQLAQANRMFAAGSKAFAKKELHWEQDNIWLVLLSGAYVPDTENHATRADLGASIVADLGPMTGRIVDEQGWCTANAIVLNRLSTTAKATQAVIYRKDLVNPLANTLIFYMTTIGGFPFQWDDDFFKLEFLPERRVFRL